jgi:cell wall-associated NlpC family hydrolase
VIKPSTGLYNKKALRTGLQTELLHGQRFDIYGRGRNWLWGQARSLIIGYIASRSISESAFQPTHSIITLRAPVFSKPDIKSRIIQALPLNAQVCAHSDIESFIQIGAGAYLHKRHVRLMTRPPEVSDFVAVAETYLHAPYIWGGTSLLGVDCSGLVQMSLCAVGVDAPRDADMQERGLGSQIDAPMKRGDLVFWPGHVAILRDADTIIHANAHHMMTAIEPLKEALSRIGEARSVRRLDL